MVVGTTRNGSVCPFGGGDILEAAKIVNLLCIPS